MTNIKEHIKKIKKSRLSNSEKIIYLLDDTKLIKKDHILYLVSPNNDVLIEFDYVSSSYSESLLRFNFDIIWNPLLYTTNKLSMPSTLYPYLSKRFNINLQKMKLYCIGGVSVKYLPYDKY